MSVALTLLLAAPLLSCGGSVLTFQDMLDSAKLVIVGRVDSMWYTADTTDILVDEGKYQRQLDVYTHIQAQLLGVYVKDDSLFPVSNSIHIMHWGGVLGDMGYAETGMVRFKKEEVFIASVTKQPKWSSRYGDVYGTTATHKYTIANDTLWGKGTSVPLGEALQLLTLHFKEVER